MGDAQAGEDRRANLLRIVRTQAPLGLMDDLARLAPIAPGPDRALWTLMIRLYADRRVYKTKHILRRSARRLIGLRP